MLQKIPNPFEEATQLRIVNVRLSFESRICKREHSLLTICQARQKQCAKKTLKNFNSISKKNLLIWVTIGKYFIMAFWKNLYDRTTYLILQEAIVATGMLKCAACPKNMHQRGELFGKVVFSFHLKEIILLAFMWVFILAWSCAKTKARTKGFVPVCRP